MRGKDYEKELKTKERGITPAYAGKSLLGFLRSGLLRDHPRVCGEKLSFAQTYCFLSGSPPRMRGKAPMATGSETAYRITPAYAGKSRQEKFSKLPYGDHPRVCGEKSTSAAIVSQRPGSPPRMRGKEAHELAQYATEGITPAYAGKSAAARICSPPAADHPRVCGEKWGGVLKAAARKGSPPRMRGKVQG